MTTELRNRIPRKDLPGFLLILFIGLSIMVGYEILLSNLNHHTVGIITGYSKDADGYKYAGYQYNIDGKLYQNDEMYDIDGIKKPKIGERYYVSFFEHIPSISTMHLDRKPVPESIQPPEGGWVGDFDSLYIVHRKELF